MVLLVRPTYSHRQWTFPGGSVERGETYEEAGIREVKGETGLLIQDLRFICEYETNFEGCKNISQAFAAQADDTSPKGDGVEIAEAAWFPIHDLPKDRVPRVDRTLTVYRSAIAEK